MGEKDKISVGQRYLLVNSPFHNKEEYILADVGQGIGRGVCLISLDNGNRWMEPVEVKRAGDITQEEFAQITTAYCGEEFRRIH